MTRFFIGLQILLMICGVGMVIDRLVGWDGGKDGIGLLIGLGIIVCGAVGAIVATKNRKAAIKNGILR